MSNKRVLLVVIILCAATACSGQATGDSRSELSGIVTDAGGSSLPLARVLVVNLSSLETQTVEVQEDERFTFRNLEPGDYAVIVAGPTGPHEPCWQSAVRQIRIEKNTHANLRVPVLLDNKRCPGG